MARRSRGDTPGSWHHVINRGIARRPLFENRDEIRFFLSRIAREVRQGRLELHAWCILSTHFHLLVRSPQGEMSEALRRSQNTYSRYFNRRHRRDGALIRGRYFSKPVTSLTYRRALVRYIDANPVMARIVDEPARYPFGSAAQYAMRDGPRWLTRTWVDAEIERAAAATRCEPRDYAATFPLLEPGPLQRVLDRRCTHRSGPDPLDDLTSSAPPGVRAWMERKALLADGVAVGQPLADIETVRAALAGPSAADPNWKPRAKVRDGWKIVEAAFLRDLVSLSWVEIAHVSGCSSATSHARYRCHGELLRDSPEYAQRAAVIASKVITSSFPDLAHPPKPINRVRLGTMVLEDPS